MTPKVVPFFPSLDNVRCQQACVKSVLKYFLPDREFSDTEIDEGTAQEGGTSWFPPAVMFLDRVGLSVQLYSPAGLNYKEFAKRGKEYIRVNVSLDEFQIQEKNGAFLSISAVQEAAKKMQEKQIAKQEEINMEELTRMLNSPDVLAIGKTYQPWLSGTFEHRNAHYVVIVKSYNHTTWRIHDPGPPSKANRKVQKRIQGEKMFPEVLVISRKQ